MVDISWVDDEGITGDTADNLKNATSSPIYYFWFFRKMFTFLKKTLLSLSPWRRS
jgi:hypothetical protein